MELGRACEVCKEFAEANSNGDLLEGLQLMEIHEELGLLTDIQRIAFNMFMEAGRKMFAPV